MDSSRREVEVKLPCDSPAGARRRLEALGARLVRDRVFEDNVLFERKVEPLKPARKLLRLRRDGGRALLTFKAPVEGDHAHKVRLEDESDVADPDAVERILAGLGFSPHYRYQKYRTLFELDGLEICLDETPLGCFIELEGAPEAIDRVAAALGCGPDRYVLDSYVELHEQWVAERGLPPEDMVFERGEEPGE
jgi:adenylate cyclase class 2